MTKIRQWRRTSGNRKWDRTIRGVQALLPLFAAAICAAAVSLMSCGDNPTAPGFPKDAPYMQGRVTSVTTSSASAVTILVEETPGAQSGAKAIARVDEITLVRVAGNSLADFRSLSPGQWVRLWFEGNVADSYPVQGTARAVAIDSLSQTPR